MKGVAMRRGLCITPLEPSRLLDLTDPALVADSTEPMPRPALRGPADLIGCDNVGNEARDTASHDRFRALSSHRGYRRRLRLR
jgi:hypothetical protein